MSYKSKLQELGITALRTGRQTCPECSADRKNKKDKCLSVTYDYDAIKYHCHHCEFEGAVSLKDKTNYFSKTQHKEYIRPPKIDSKDVLEPLYRYFNKRGISQKTLNTYNVTLDKNNNIIFPYTKNEVLVNNKTRLVNKETGKKTFLQSKNAEQTLYGMDQIPTNEKTLYWVEGEVDVFSLYELGKYAVSPNQGGTDKKLDCIENCFDFIDSFEEHIIAVDADEVGRGLQERLKERLQGKAIRVIDWHKTNKEYKDANDFLQKEKRQELLNALNSSEEVLYEGFETLDDNLQYLKRRFLGDTEKAFSTGIDCFDDVMLLQTKRVMCVTGIPGKGKSFFVDNLLYNSTMIHGWKHLVCSFEGSSGKQIDDFAKMMTQKPLKSMKWDEYKHASEWFFDNIKKTKTDRSWNIDQILEAAEYAVRRYGVKTVTIDPYSKLDQGNYTREDQYIRETMNKLGLFAKKFDVLVIVVAHPVTFRERDKVPTMYDISGGAQWYNMVDYGISIHRYNDEHGRKLTQTKVFIEKIKDEVIGDPSGGERYLKMCFKQQKLIPVSENEERYDASIDKEIKQTSKYK